MKINERSGLNTSKAQSSQIYEAPRSDGSSSPAAGRAADAGDNSDLGSQASLLSQTQSAGASESSANVQRLQALIRSGQYQVDPAALSKSIVNASIDGY
jgi:anti-sigma28 factor (negative regulator of flagellin synthesis)